MSTKIIDKGWKKFKREIDALGKKEIVVGVLKGVPYAGYLEFGTSKMPPRPFMRDTFAQDGQKMIAAISAAYSRLHVGSNAYKEASRLGLMYQGFIQRKIRKGPWAPITMRTIMRKKSTKILIDKGRLIGAITFKIR